MSAASDMSATSAMLAAQIQNLAPALLGSPPSSKSRTEWRWGSKGSLAIEVHGPKRGQWYDHESGVGGDALDLVARLLGNDRKAAWHWGLTWLGHAPGQALSAPSPKAPTPTLVAQKERSASMARMIRRECVALAGSLAEVYLGSRDLKPQPGAPLLFHAACPRGADRLPAMIGLMTDPVTNEPCGIHRTFLKTDGSGKADGGKPKMMLGHAGVIRLAPDDEVTTRLGIAEGIETGLALVQRAGWRPVWACGSSGAIARFPVLRGVECLTIFADADDRGTGLKAAHECARRWHDAGREAVIMRPPHGADWFDALKAAA